MAGYGVGRKRPPSSSEGSVSRNKHKIGYDASWKLDFPWHIPVYDGTASTVVGLLCSLCKRYGTKPRNHSSTWTTEPCTQLRRDALQRHKESLMHKEAQQVEVTRLASEKDGGIRTAFSSRIVVQRKALIGALRIMYWLVKEEVAHTTKFNSLKDLSILLGCNYLHELNIGRNAHYTSEQSIAELLQCLSQVLEEQILRDLQSSEFFSLMTDESTDIAVMKQLVLVGRYLIPGVGIKTSFLCITDIPNGTAETIEGAMLKFVSDKGLQIARLCAFGSDGASVMTGRLSGVAVRLMQHSPRMIAVHCVNHRLALAAAHASDSVPYLKQFKSILQTLFFFYQNSAVRMANLHLIQDILNDPLIKCKLAKDVRWLSHDNAIKALIRTLPSILVSLDREASQNGEPTAHGLYKFMKSYKFVATAYLLSDILPHLSRLSRIFQKENVDLSLVQPCLKTTIDTINKYKDVAGPNLSKVDQVLATDLKDFSIEVNSAQKEAFKSNIQVPYIEAIVNQLHDRFPHVELLSSFSIFDPQSLPANKDELTTYGQDKVEVFSATYGEGPDPVIDTEEYSSEWDGFKMLIKNNYSSTTMQQVLKHFCTNQSLRDMYPQLTKLATIGALIPVSTAECERAFSSMNRIKTELRNRLKTLTLDFLMRISIEGPSLAEFDFERAADIWGGMRNRRLSVGHSGHSSSSS